MQRVSALWPLAGVALVAISTLLRTREEPARVRHRAPRRATEVEPLESQTPRPVESRPPADPHARSVYGSTVAASSPSSLLEGIVVGLDGRPVGGAHVGITGIPGEPWGFFVTTTSPDGRFEYRGRDPGHEVAVEVDDLRGSSAVAHVRFSSSLVLTLLPKVELVLESVEPVTAWSEVSEYCWMVVKGRMIDGATKAPLEYAQVTLERGGMVSSVPVAPDGRFAFRIDRGAERSVDVRFSAPGHSSDSGYQRVWLDSTPTEDW